MRPGDAGDAGGALSTLGERKLDRDFESRPGGTVAQAQTAPIASDEALYDRHAEAGAVGLGARRIHPVERPGHERQLVFRNAWPFVDHGQFDARMGYARLEDHVRNAITFAQPILASVLEQMTRRISVSSASITAEGARRVISRMPSSDDMRAASSCAITERSTGSGTLCTGRA
jgi:hypothetical protein